MHILLVEQDEDVRKLLLSLLITQGYTVSAVRNPEEALAIVDSNGPDAILSSLVFHEMSGFEFCRKLRAMPATASKLIVALTGYSINGIEKQITEAGFDKYFLKPVSIHVLLSFLDDNRVQSPRFG